MTETPTPESNLPEALQQNPKRQKPTAIKGSGEKVVRETVEEKVLPDGTKRKVVKRVVQKPPTKSTSTIDVQKVFFWFFGLLFIGIILFYVFLLWGLMSNSLENPLFAALGMTSRGLQNTLITLTNIVFGLLSLVLLIVTLVQFFRYATLDNENKQKKQVFLVRGILFLFGFLIMGGVWIALFSAISGQTTEAEEPEIQTYIITEPVSVTGITAPQTVKFDIGTRLFTQINQNNITEITWDFDGDGVVDARGPEVSYRFLEIGENGGRYPVDVVVKYRVNPLDPNSEEKMFTTSREVIVSNEAIVAEIVASPEAGYAPLDVELSAAKSFDPDGAIVYYEWDLNNDGEYEKKGGTLDTVEKTWAQIGKYTVNLRVTGQNGDSAVTSQEVNVVAQDQNLSAEISTLTPTEGYAPLKVVFDGSQSFARVGKIVKYEWFVGSDAEGFVGRKFEKVFRDPGEYTVKLIIESDDQERNEATAVVTVWEEEGEVKLRIDTTPEADKQGVVRGVAPFTVTMNGQDSIIQNAVEWQWDFDGDGITDKYAPAAQHTYYTPGEYTALMTVYDSNDRAHELTQKVIVTGVELQAKVTATPNNGSVPLKVRLDASGSIAPKGQEIINYVWTLPGQDPLSYGAQINYEFQQTGLFPIQLQIMSSSGETAETEVFVTVRDIPLAAGFTATPQDGRVPLRVKFDPSTTQGIVDIYSWDFGDGSASTQELSPTHTFNTPGTYVVTLTVTDERGIISETTETITVRSE